MTISIYINDQTKLEDYVTNSTLIRFDCKNFFVEKSVELCRKYIHTYLGEP